MKSVKNLFVLLLLLTASTSFAGNGDVDSATVSSCVGYAVGKLGHELSKATAFCIANSSPEALECLRALKNTGHDYSGARLFCLANSSKAATDCVATITRSSGSETRFDLSRLSCVNSK